MRYYKGFTTDKGKIKDPTLNNELLKIANSKFDFNEQDIENKVSNLKINTEIERMDRSE